ncbi:hypothetical protein HDR58_04550 [bacterium]|nr:hypothetical protein [bacterium]
MKKFAIITALVLFGTQVFAAQANTNVNYNKKPAQKTQAVNQTKQNNSSVKQQDDNYLLKYNINDLEAAPWLNGGKRKI